VNGLCQHGVLKCVFCQQPAESVCPHVCPNRPGRGHEWYLRTSDKLRFCRDCGFDWKPVPTLEDRIRERIAQDDGTRYTLDEVAAMFGVDLERHNDGTGAAL
jgi:hypothetical protein